MGDKYGDFAELAAKHEKGVDYKITARPVVGSRILIIAPHGGKIEPGTSRLAKKIAGSDYSLYLFEGKMGSDNLDLHITSHKFDEPYACQMVSNSDTAIGIHGRQDDSKDDCEIYIGGLNSDLKDRLGVSIGDAGFKAKTSGHRLPAVCKENICNRGQTDGGAQLELPATLRTELRDDRDQMEKLAAAIRKAIAAHLSSLNGTCSS